MKQISTVIIILVGFLCHTEAFAEEKKYADCEITWVDADGVNHKGGAWA
ncbi:MAG: hypothetical protein AB7G93_21405 [Bdellovibrionales bacterium]